MKRRTTVPEAGVRAIVAVLMAGAFIAPFFASGCSGKTACIQRRADQGACPSREQALSTMQSACGPVLSVDSDAELTDENLCCYDVTEVSNEDGIGCTSPPSPNPLPGVTAVTTGVTTGPATSCGGLFVPACDECMQAQCCGQVLGCFETSGCFECLSDRSRCLSDLNGADQADGVTDCMRVFCSEACFGEALHEPACDANLPGGSSGACWTIDNQDTLCNPVSNEPCGDSSTCEREDSAIFACVGNDPLPRGICSACGATGWCDAGYTCFDGRCTRICCEDTDCGSGHCDHSLMEPTGLCLQGLLGQGGAGGAGGQGS